MSAEIPNKTTERRCMPVPAGPSLMRSAALGCLAAGLVAAPVAARPASERVVYSFDYTDLPGSVDTPLTDLGGTLYGPAYSVGGTGLIYSVTPSGAQAVVHRFGGGADGSNPNSLIAVGSLLYGTTASGGGTGCHGAGCGTAFQLDPTGNSTVLFDFRSLKGTVPTSLVRFGGGFVGTTQGQFPNDQGVVFKLTLSDTSRPIYTFRGGTDGTAPNPGLLNVGGTIYGTTPDGGASNSGTVFMLTQDGRKTVLHAFASPDGARPNGGLLRLGNTYFGTTRYTGLHGIGTVYAITPDGTFTLLHNFNGIRGGERPLGGLISVNGLIYGTTDGGGKCGQEMGGYGVVFSISQTGEFKIVHDFGCDSLDGIRPNNSLTHIGGTLYGTTAAGGANGEGVVFAITP